MIKVEDLFYLESGNGLALNSLNQVAKGVNFVARTSKNNGISAKVSPIADIDPSLPWAITVACSGSVMESFLQEEPFYSAYHIYILRPKIELTRNEIIFYCSTLRHNKFKYSFGRQANKTLGQLLIPSPEDIPDWVHNPSVSIPDRLDGSVIDEKIELPPTSEWEEFSLAEYFEMFSGKYVAKDSYDNGSTPLVSASNVDNGTKEWTNLEPMFQGGCLTIGKVQASTFYQEVPFCATGDVCVLKPKFAMSKFTGLFLKMIIGLESPKWGYGRQIRLNNCQRLIVKLPFDANGEPNWQLMEDYIKSLPYSASI